MDMITFLFFERKSETFTQRLFRSPQRRKRYIATPHRIASRRTALPILKRATALSLQKSVLAQERLNASMSLTDRVLPPSTPADPLGGCPESLQAGLVDPDVLNIGVFSC
jgi:hypothetical protein